MSPRVERRHHHHHTPVEMWSDQQVAGWLQNIGLLKYSRAFLNSGISGEILLNVDSALLKQLGVVSKTDRDRIKEKVREIRKQYEREYRNESNLHPNYGKTLLSNLRYYMLMYQVYKYKGLLQL